MKVKKPETKVCRDCKVAKPRSDFYVFPNGWVHSYCRPCHTARCRKWAERNPARVLASRVRRRDRAKKYYDNWRKTRRIEALKVLGGKCVRCGFDDPRALQIDHINGGGHKERTTMQSVQKLHTKILAGETAGYQLLCANCNWIKRYENDEHRAK